MEAAEGHDERQEGETADTDEGAEEPRGLPGGEVVARAGDREREGAEPESPGEGEGGADGCRQLGKALTRADGGAPGGPDHGAVQSGQLLVRHGLGVRPVVGEARFELGGVGRHGVLGDTGGRPPRLPVLGRTVMSRAARRRS